MIPWLAGKCMDDYQASLFNPYRLCAGAQKNRVKQKPRMHKRTRGRKVNALEKV